MRHALQCGLAALVLLLVSAGVARAQRGTVRGQILDQSGAGLAGVEVQLINLESAAIRRHRTTIVGDFSFEALPAGQYALGASRDGYAAWRSEPFEVLPGIPVEARAITLRTLPAAATNPRSGLEEMALEYGLVREQIASLPVVVGSEGRTSVDKLLHLVPGLHPAQSLDIDPFSGRASAVTANGSRRSFINYKLHGASNNAQNRITGAQAANLGPVPEAMETLRVITHTYSAREGRNAGAVVAPTFRSATDLWNGHLRGYVRPGWNQSDGAFDRSIDRMSGWVGGGQAGGPIMPRYRMFAFIDGESWLTNRKHTSLRRVLSDNEREGNFFGFETPPTDPLTGVKFPNARIPVHRLDPLMQKYLDAFVPRANLEGGWVQTSSNLISHGQVLLGRLDSRGSRFAHSFSTHIYNNRVIEPTSEAFTASPGTVEKRSQVSTHAQYALTHTISPDMWHSLRLSLQRLSGARRRGHSDLGETPAESFGFDFLGQDPTVLPNVRLWNEKGQLQLHVAPFIDAEESVQTTLQLGYDAELRHRGQTVRVGLQVQQGTWPFRHVENYAGSFSFPAPPAPPARFRGQGLRDLLLGRPGEYRLQTPRSLDLRWQELATYAEGEIRPWRDLKITVGLRLEDQPPATDSLDRLMTFREGTQSLRFPDSLPNLLFPGDADPRGGSVPRSTIETTGRNLSPRIGIAYAPAVRGRVARWLVGDPGRTVVRIAYGVFFDHGAFAGSSAAALFQATYPPFSNDNRFILRNPDGAFMAPLAALPSSEPSTFKPVVVRYPILVFDPGFQNALARHWNLSWQRLLPGRVFFTGTYLGTRSNRLQQQRELNGFVRNPLHSFGFVHQMRRFSRFADIRSIESAGNARYEAVQLRANRYLSRGLAFDVGYTWSQSFDNGSSVLGDELVNEDWAYSNFDRRHSLTANWQYRFRLPRRWSDSARWAAGWSVSGIWRWRSGLPLDIRQTEDPTYTFEQVGRPDRVRNFTPLDPRDLRTFEASDLGPVTGRFAFDPSAFRAVRPTSFSETRPGTSRRNEYRQKGFHQWDFRISREFRTSELVTTEVGIDVLNAFGNTNWAAPFTNIDHVFFGVVRMAGLGRTVQTAIRFRF